MLNGILVATIAVLSPAFNGQDVESSFFGGSGTETPQKISTGTVDYIAHERISYVQIPWNELTMPFSSGTLLRVESLNESVPYWKIAEVSYETPDGRKGMLKPHELPLAFDMRYVNWEGKELGPYVGVPIGTGLDVGLAESDRFPSGTVFKFRFFRTVSPYKSSERGLYPKMYRLCKGTIYGDGCPFLFPEAPEPPEWFDPKTEYLGKRPVKPAGKKLAETVVEKKEPVPKLPPNPAPWLPKLSSRNEAKLESQVAELFARATAGKDERWKRDFAEKVARKAIAVASKTAVPMKKRSAFAFVATLMEKEMLIRYR